MTAEAAAFAAPAAKAERAARLRVVAGGLWSGALLVLLGFLVLYPVAMLLLGALTNTNPVVDGFGVFDLSLANFVSVLGNPNVHGALANSLIACTGGTALAVVIGLAFSWIVVRTNTPWRSFVAAASYLWAWIGLPGGLYGTIWILTLAFVARFMPDTMKSLSTSFLQIHRELEEAAWVCGKGRIGTIRTIVLPLARPGTVAAMTLLFILAIRELGSSLFLYTSDTMVMAVLLLDYYEGGNTGKTAAFSLVQTALLALLIGVATWLSRGSTDASAGRAG